MSRVFISPLATPFHSLVSIFPIPSRYISIFRAPPPRYFSPSLTNRTGIAPGKNVLEVEKKLLKFVPREYLLDAHHWLILHGRYVCKARKPQCGSCRIEDLCEYKHKTSDD